MALSDQLPYVIVHGGVQKTATSFIQGRLKRNAGRLKKQGVHYVHHRKTRKDYTIPCQLNGYDAVGLGYDTVISDAALCEISKEFFHGIEAGAGERIILSDENMPGHSSHCVRKGKLYGFRKPLIPIFANHIPYPVAEVHIAIRNYADFFASSYVEFLRSSEGRRHVTEAQMKRGVISVSPNWQKFIGDVREAFPNSELVVWRHEDFGDLSQKILQNLCGDAVDVNKFAIPKRGRSRPSASHRAIKEMLYVIQRYGPAALIEKRVELQEKYPRSEEYPAYDPWEQSEREHLTRLYDQDVEELKSLSGVRFL